MGTECRYTPAKSEDLCQSGYEKYKNQKNFLWGTDRPKRETNNPNQHAKTVDLCEKGKDSRYPTAKSEDLSQSGYEKTETIMDPSCPVRT